MSPKLSDINVNKSRFFKVNDLTEATGKGWAVSQLPVVIESAEVSEYPSDGNDPPEPAYLVTFKGHLKPFGLNLTNRRVLEGIVGSDAEWDTASLAGISLILYAEATSMGNGLRIRYNDAAAKVGNDPIRDDEPAGDEPPPHTDDDSDLPF